MKGDNKAAPAKRCCFSFQDVLYLPELRDKDLTIFNYIVVPTRCLSGMGGRRHAEQRVGLARPLCRPDGIGSKPFVWRGPSDTGRGRRNAPRVYLLGSVGVSSSASNGFWLIRSMCRLPHFAITSSSSRVDCPYSVREYSTFGGTWVYTSR